MIENLNTKQEELMDIIAQDYENNVLSGDDSYNVDEIVSGIDFIYNLAELNAPRIIICTSPMDMAEQAELKENDTFDYLGNGYDSGWTAFYDFMQQIGVDFDQEWEFDKWKNFIKDSGVFATCLFENIAFVCIRPCEVHRKENGDLHNENGMAIKWCDGYGEYSLNGVIVDEAIVITPAEDIDCNIILKEKNAEVRREIIRKVGINQVIEKLGAKSIERSSDGQYELLNFDCIDGRFRPYLKMLNPSIGTWHIEGVHPDCNTIEKALAWRNDEDQYEQPAILT
jgi:hypothetical protein